MIYDTSCLIAPFFKVEALGWEAQATQFSSWWRTTNECVRGSWRHRAMDDLASQVLRVASTTMTWKLTCKRFVTLNLTLNSTDHLREVEIWDSGVFFSGADGSSRLRSRRRRSVVIISLRVQHDSLKRAKKSNSDSSINLFIFLCKIVRVTSV